MTQTTHRDVRVDVHVDPTDYERALATDVRAGLMATPKERPPKYFYDDRGSELFDEITRLPEYYPTRAERAILEVVAPEIAAQRKSVDRDRYERDLALLGRVRDAYRTLAADPSWVRLDGERPKDVIAAEVFTAVSARLALP